MGRRFSGFESAIRSRRDGPLRAKILGPTEMLSKERWKKQMADGAYRAGAAGVCGPAVYRRRLPALPLPGTRAEVAETEQVLLPSAPTGDARRSGFQVHGPGIRADHPRGHRRRHLGVHRIEGRLDRKSTRLN